MWLACSQRCGGRLFRVLLAELDIDATGDYQGHRVVEPGYICLNCGSPAIDVGEVPLEMAAEREAERIPQPVDVLCPMCETKVQVGLEMECPVCGSYLEAS
jgi:DNA-directed RNA polymerase subunit RPC12/RpoP